MSINKKKFRKCMPLLKTLSKISPEERQQLITFLDEKGCEALINCIQNTLYNKQLRKATVPLRPTLLKHKLDFKNLLNEKKTSKQKRDKLVQVGGFPLGLILSTLLPIVEQFL